MAARLQKIPGATFGFNLRGFLMTDADGTENETFKKAFVVVKMAVRGIGDNELVGLVRKEFDGMRAADRRQFKTL
jgi:hypothetical protein